MKYAIVAFIGALLIGAMMLGSHPGVSTSAQEAFYPEPSDYAVDSAGVLTPEQLTAIIGQLRSSDDTTHQLGVAIVKTTAPLTIEEYGIKLAEKWKVGHSDLDNGAIIIIATEDRKARVEVGYGLEGQIPDAVAGRILRDDMVPFLKDNKWFEAIEAGITSVNSKIK